MVIDYLQELPDQQDILVAYIYCDYKRQLEQTPERLMASLLKQILQQQLLFPEFLAEYHRRHSNKGTSATMEEISKTLEFVILNGTRTHILVDALDELASQGRVCQVLLAALGKLQYQRNFNLMVTSRYTPTMAYELRDPSYLEIKAQSKDILKFVHNQMDELATMFTNNTNMQNAIAGKVTDAADGMQVVF